MEIITSKKRAKQVYYAVNTCEASLLRSKYMRSVYITKSTQETQKLGEKLTDSLKGESASWRIIALYGELGSGKTTFVQGLARGLGLGKRVLSPTFVFIRPYKLSSGGVFYHVDLYRLTREDEAYGLGLIDFWNNPKNIMAIEWAEKIKEILPKKRIDIYFEYLNETERKIRFRS